MSAKSAVSIQDLRKAIETRNAASLKAYYAPNAELTIIDSDNPPSKPRTLKGTAEIGAFLDDVYSRDMVHTLDMGVRSDGHLAFVQGCKYTDGTRVIASSVAEVGPQGITKQTTVQAWDN